MILSPDRRKYSYRFRAKASLIDPSQESKVWTFVNNHYKNCVPLTIKLLRAITR